MECLWALERHSAVSKEVQAFLEFWLWQEKEEEPQPVEIESKEEESVEEDGSLTVNPLHGMFVSFRKAFSSI